MVEFGKAPRICRDENETSVKPVTIWLRFVKLLIESCLSRSFSKPQDHRSRCSRWVCFCNLVVGGTVSEFLRDASKATAPRCRGGVASAILADAFFKTVSTSSIIWLRFVNSLFDVVPGEVLRAALRTLLDDVSQWLCFREFDAALSRGWRRSRQPNAPGAANRVRAGGQPDQHSARRWWSAIASPEWVRFCESHTRAQEKCRVLPR